jgi:hypothetical protein
MPDTPDTPDTSVSTATDPLDAELRRIAGALVAEAPDVPRLSGPSGSYDDGQVVELVLTRGRPPVRRRVPRVPRLAVAAAATVALVAGGVIAVTAGDDDTGEPRYGFLAQAGLEPAPQRLIYDDRQHELTADGEVVPLELNGLDPHGPPRPLPDGGHVVVGVRPVPYPPPEGFNEFTDLTFELAVVGADGEVEVERDIGNEQSTLVGVTSSDAIINRQPEDEQGRKAGPASIVAHDLDTGDERVLHEDASFDPNTNAWARWAVVGTDLVTVAGIEHLDAEGGTPITPETVECVLRTTDLTNGDDDQRPLDLPCYQVMGVQASPDGSQVAVVYESNEPDQPIGATYLAVIDLPSGEVVHDELLGQRVDCSQGGCPPGIEPIDYHGIAWDDAATVRVAITDTSSSPGELVVMRIAIG